MHIGYGDQSLIGKPIYDSSNRPTATWESQEEASAIDNLSLPGKI